MSNITTTMTLFYILATLLVIAVALIVLVAKKEH